MISTCFHRSRWMRIRTPWRATGEQGCLIKVTALLKRFLMVKNTRRILRKRRLILIFFPLVLGALGMALTFLNAPVSRYASLCTLEVNGEFPVPGIHHPPGIDPVDALSSEIKNDAVLREAARKAGLIPAGDSQKKGFQETSARLLKDLRSRISVKRGPLGDIFRIEVVDQDPRLSSDLANALASTFVEHLNRWQERRLTSSLEGIETQIMEARQRLRESQGAFETFSRDNRVLSMEAQSQGRLEEDREIRKQLRPLSQDERELTTLLERLENFIRSPSKPHNGRFYSPRVSKEYLGLNNTLEALLRKEKSSEKIGSPPPNGSPPFDPKVAETARKMATLLESQIAAVREKIGPLEEAAGRSDGETRALLETRLTFERLKKRMEADEELAALLETRKRETLIRHASMSGGLRVIEPAVPPRSPVNPPRFLKNTALGVLIGLCLALIGVFTFEALAASRGRVEKVSKNLDIRVLGAAPMLEFSADPGLPGGSRPDGEDPQRAGTDPALASHYSPTSVLAENFRSIRTRILSGGEAESSKTFLVSSALPQEGKTFVAVNLAVTAAQAGMKTLLIGADLRRPGLARVFGIEESPGLAQILVGGVPRSDALRTVTDLMMGHMAPDGVLRTPGLDRLHIITAGTVPPHPGPLLDSDRLRRLLEEAEAEYDLVILDSPPALSGTDATVLGGKVRHALIVWRMGKMPGGLLKKVKALFDQVGCSLSGIILNGIDGEISSDAERMEQGPEGFFLEEPPEREAKMEVEQVQAIARETDEIRLDAAEDALRSPAAAASGEGVKNPFKPGIIHLLVALLFLVAGLLWQSGLLEKNVGQDAGNGAGGPAPSGTPSAPPSGAVLVRPIDRPPAAAPPAEETPGPERADSLQEEEEPPVLPVLQPSPPPQEAAQEEDSLETAPPASYPYALYLGSFQTLKRAKRAVSLYSREDLPAYWVRVKFKEKGLWYRVYAGFFKSQTDAKGFIQTHSLPEAKVKHTQYANRLGIFDSADQLNAAVRSLQNKGYAPYVIRTPDGRAVLFVGAYLTREGAEQQHRDLERGGVTAEVVSR